MTDYRVVYESGTNMGGSAFIRTYKNYKDEAEFRSFHDPESGYKVIAQGVSQLNANKMCLLAPTLCNYLFEIEEFFQEGRTNLDHIESLLDKAIDEADNIRNSRMLLGMGFRGYTPPEGFELHTLTLCGDPSPKGRIMAAIYKAYNQESDYVSPLLAKFLVKEVIDSLKHEQEKKEEKSGQ